MFKRNFIISIVFILPLLYTTNIAQNGNSLKKDLENLEKRANQLVSQSDKLAQVIFSNENLIMEENMEKMHANKNMVLLIQYGYDMSISINKITNQLSIIAESKEVINNSDTYSNLTDMISDIDKIILSAESFMSSIKESQEILNNHLIK